MLTKLGAKLIEQIRMHELAIIRDVQANDLFTLKGFRKLSPQPINVRLLHAKDDVGPSQMSFRHHNARVRLRANGANLIMR